MTEIVEKKKANGIMQYSNISLEYLTDCLSNKEEFINFLKPLLIERFPNLSNGKKYI